MRPPGSGRLGGISCGRASVAPDCETLQSRPEGKFKTEKTIKNVSPHLTRNEHTHTIKPAWVLRFYVGSADLL